MNQYQIYLHLQGNPLWEEAPALCRNAFASYATSPMCTKSNLAEYFKWFYNGWCSGVN